MSRVTALQKPQPARDLHQELAALQAGDPSLTQAEISRQSGIGQARLNQWMAGRYKGDVARLERDLATWIDTYNERQLAGRMLPQAPDWVETPTADRITSALGYAQVAADLTVIYGGAGLGKTRSLKHYAETNPNVWIVETTPTTNTRGAFLRNIAWCLGHRIPKGHADILERSLIDRIRGTNGLLIVDEAQFLNEGALETARRITELAGIGLALSGNERVYAQLTGGTRAADFAQLFSRIGKRVRLTRATQADIDAIIAAWSIDAKPCRDVLREIAAKPGALRGLTKVLRLASMFAAGDGRAITCEDIKSAWRDLGGDQ